MPRTEPTTRSQTPAARRLLALPVLGLLLAAAIGAQAGAADAPAPEAPHRIALAIHADQPYALVIDGQHGVNMMGGSDDWPDIKQLKTRLKGDFLWFRADGKSWIIQDPQVLAKARAAWAPVDRLGEQMDAYGREMDRHGKVMDALGKQIGEAAAATQPDQTRMHEVSLRMSEENRPMKELGRKMKALGKDMKRESHDADETVRALIRDAIERGLVNPAPQV